MLNNGKRFSVQDMRSTAVLRFIRLPNLPLGNTERLCFTHRLLPLLVGSLNLAPQHNPFAPSRFRDFIATTGRSAPGLRIRTLALVVLPLEASPFASEIQVPT